LDGKKPTFQGPPRNVGLHTTQPPDTAVRPRIFYSYLLICSSLF